MSTFRFDRCLFGFAVAAMVVNVAGTLSADDLFSSRGLSAATEPSPNGAAVQIPGAQARVEQPPLPPAPPASLDQIAQQARQAGLPVRARFSTGHGSDRREASAVSNANDTRPGRSPHCPRHGSDYVSGQLVTRTTECPAADQSACGTDHVPCESGASFSGAGTANPGNRCDPGGTPDDVSPVG